MMKGLKWLNGAGYLSAEDRAQVLAVVDDAKAAGYERVGVRCPTYIGEPCPIAVVVYGAGEAIFKSVYRETRLA